MSAGLSITTGFCTSAAAGILGALLLAPFRELRRFFFAVNAFLALVLLGFTLPLRPPLGGASGGAVAAWAGGASFLTLALAGGYIAALYLPGAKERHREFRGLLAAAAAAAFAATTIDGWAAAGRGQPAWAFAAAAVSAAALLGAVIVAMILGHWYLVRWRLPIDHLVRFARVLAGAIGARALLLVVGVAVAGAASPEGLGDFLHALAVDRGFFFWQRMLFGIAGPAVLSWMVYETARIRSTQSATGILYIEVIFVVIGEFLARYLTLAGAGPL